MKKYSTEEIEELFEKFWVAGMVKVKKKAAKKMFSKITKNYDLESFTDYLIADIAKRLEIKQFGFDSMHPTTYLNGERWEDEYRGRINETHQPSYQTHSQRQHEQAQQALREMEAGDTSVNVAPIRQIR